MNIMEEHISRWFCACILLALLTGCANLVSPARIHERDLASRLFDIQQFHAGHPEVHAPLEVVGHGAGAFRQYPMNVFESESTVQVRGNHWPLKAAYALPVEQLIDKSFRFYQIDAVEIDVQVPPENHPLCRALGDTCAVVMHDTPDWDAIAPGSPAYQYLLENSLVNILDFVVQQGFHEKHIIYLDLKSPRKCQLTDYANDSCKRYPDLLLPILKKYVAIERHKAPTATGGASWLRLVSFSPGLLRYLHQRFEGHTPSGKALRDATSFGFIAGYSGKGFLGLKPLLAQAKGPVPELSTAMSETIAAAPYIDRIWFSVRGLESPAEEINRLASLRTVALKNNSALKPFAFSVATYDVSWQDYQSGLSALKPALTSFMIDVDTSP
ncbi:hypothetical protein L1F30_13265 [Simiduia sp. 21SJ11W-1]|uniref:hypothetical protein n=1 Tax=Simiduia sp. 21SJ11W-1 TaxID=2909669 RepID=UPI0020A0F723|nr:hypothetical protein [Simiduia sp. 21SJ11W-1]UTA47126.1 hypothetical protein L1F30_13265 [Simiduia sp. 21SJ11W-1]